MKAIKLEILVIDHEGLGADEIVGIIEGARYPNRCIAPDVQSIEVRDIGEWSDDHPLNNGRTAHTEYRRLFGNTKEE